MVPPLTRAAAPSRSTTCTANDYSKALKGKTNGMANRTDQDKTRQVRERTAPATTPSKKSIREDRKDVAAEHRADRTPTPDEERAAEQQAEDADPRVASAYKRALERGARQKGEGRPGV